jgi:hypothetical protein
MPVLEAMASGLPVVTTDCLGVRTFCRHGDNCLMALPDDVAGEGGCWWGAMGIVACVKTDESCFVAFQCGTASNVPCAALVALSCFPWQAAQRIVGSGFVVDPWSC